MKTPAKIFLLAIPLSLFFLLPCADAGIKFKEIEFASPKYLQRKAKFWERGGRLVGVLNRAPEKFTIEVRKAGTADAVLTETHYGWLSIYETALIPPGKYSIVVKAEGFKAQTLKSLEIKAGSDCILDIKFGATVYDNG